jgi:hypothetical protein
MQRLHLMHGAVESGSWTGQRGTCQARCSGGLYLVVTNGIVPDGAPVDVH